METISYKRFITLLSDNAYKESIPLIGSFELTPLCNLNCKMCYVHLQDPSVKERMLRGEEWISLMRQAVEAGMVSTLLTGGEALTHPDFWDIYTYLAGSGVTVRLKSNGLLLGEEACARFREVPPYMIDVSLYGCSSESYLAVTEADAFRKVTENITRVIETGLPLRLMITPSRYMSPWTEEIMAFAKSFGVPVNVNNILIDPNGSTGRKKEDFDLTEEESNAVQAEKNALFPPEFMLPEEEEELFRGIEKRPDISAKGLYCNGGRTGFAVNWDGTMGPCLSFPREIVCARPMRDGFAGAWKEVSEAVRNYEIPQKCRSCAINTRCHFCPTQHSKTAAQHLCSPEVCAYWENYYGRKA